MSPVVASLAWPFGRAQERSFYCWRGLAIVKFGLTLKLALTFDIESSYTGETADNTMIKSWMTIRSYIKSFSI